MKDQKSQSSGKSEIDLALSCRPKFYPSIVLRFNPESYCYFPVYISPYDEKLKEDESSIIGMYRDLIVKTEKIEDKDFVMDALLKITQQEAMHHKCKACLCLSPERAIYYIPETGSYIEKDFVPWHTNWLNDAKYKKLEIYDLDSNGNHYQRVINKSVSRQYYFLPK